MQRTSMAALPTLAGLGLWFCALGALQAAPPATSQAGPPEGRWVVEAVVQWPPSPVRAWTGQDFVWLHRVLDSTPDALAFDAATCRAPRWSVQSSTLGTLLSQTFPAEAPVSMAARPKDVGLKLPAATALQVWRVACADTDAAPVAGATWLRPPEGTWQARDDHYTPGPETWWARLPDGRWLMRDSDRLLTLLGIPPQAAAQPSFDCSRARSVVEKAICKDHDLAGWDRSMADAWRRLLQRQSRAAPALREQHKAWLTERDACGDGAREALKACLLDSMHGYVASMQGS